MAARACSGRDNMSRLPDELVLRIISRLAVEDAISFSAVSTRWRYLYASTSNIEFFFPEEDPTDINDIMNAVDTLFFLRNKRFIDKFRFHCSKLETFDAFQPCRLQGWIHICVVWHGIREIDICLPDYLDLPPSLYTCKTLEKLHLSCESGIDMAVPDKVFLPSLKDLYVENAFSLGYDATACERLISNCPVLEMFVYKVEGDDNRMSNGAAELVVSNPTLKHLSISCDRLEVVIDAPSLISVEYLSMVLDSHKFINVQSLTWARLDLRCDDDCDRQYILAATDLVRGISNIRILVLCPGTLHDLIRFNIPLPAFHNLTQLSLSLGWDLDFAELLRFLACCDNLEALYFVVLPFEFHLGAQDTLEDNSGRGWSSSLKKIHITDFSGGYKQMEMIKYFLKNAGVLETLKVLHWSDTRIHTANVKQETRAGFGPVPGPGWRKPDPDPAHSRPVPGPLSCLFIPIKKIENGYHQE